MKVIRNQEPKATLPPMTITDVLLTTNQNCPFRLVKRDPRMKGGWSVSLDCEYEDEDGDDEEKVRFDLEEGINVIPTSTGLIVMQQDGQLGQYFFTLSFNRARSLFRDCGFQVEHDQLIVDFTR